MTAPPTREIAYPVRVALVHDWLVTHRGGEQVLLELARMFPEAPIFTLVYQRAQVHPELARRRVITSFVQKLPGSPQSFRRYLPLFPRAVERWDLSDYDLVISTSHCVAKGVLTRPGQWHLSYVHTPMRYLWDQLEAYLPPRGRMLTAPAARLATRSLRRWDVESSRRPTRLLANSDHVAQRIAAVWHRRAHVVHPPVEVCFWNDAPERPRQGYLVVSALVPYKRVDLAVAWATRHRRPLRVIGTGSERERLERIAGPTVELLGEVSSELVRQAYAEAEALLFCGVEDFGMVPVEAMAAGCPVVAFGQGGALETVIDGRTGVLFHEPTIAGLHAALQRFESFAAAGAFSRQQLRQHAQRFDVGHFVAAIAEHLEAIGVPPEVTAQFRNE